MQVGGKLRHINNTVIMPGFFCGEVNLMIFGGYGNICNGIRWVLLARDLQRSSGNVDIF